MLRHALAVAIAPHLAGQRADLGIALAIVNQTGGLPRSWSQHHGSLPHHLPQGAKCGQ